MFKENYILLSFDVEEFDIPLEYGQSISNREQLETGYAGLEALMNIVDRFPVRGTFFTTAHFARHYEQAIRKIAEKHEIGSHTFHHSSFATQDLANSKKLLESLIKKEVRGLRMPRMMKVPMKDVHAAGYAYDSSVNPTLLPGRYNSLHLPRTPYREEGVLRFPASVTPSLRIPLFWLSFKNLPYPTYLRLVKKAMAKDGYVCLYFHPWEFTDLKKYKMPGYVKGSSEKAMQQKLTRLLSDLQSMGSFITMEHYIQKMAL